MPDKLIFPPDASDETKFALLLQGLNNIDNDLKDVQRGQNKIVYALLGLILTILGGLVIAAATHGFGVAG